MPVIIERVSFSEFKELVTLHKFTPYGFVALYGYGKYGWKYRILMNGKNKTKALRLAYYLLFGDLDADDASEVQISLDENRPYKMPISCNFSFAIKCDLTNVDVKTLTKEVIWS